jgi:hypothetical protein
MKIVITIYSLLKDKNTGKALKISSNHLNGYGQSLANKTTLQFICDIDCMPF